MLLIQSAWRFRYLTDASLIPTPAQLMIGLKTSEAPVFPPLLAVQESARNRNWSRPTLRHGAAVCRYWGSVSANDFYLSTSLNCLLSGNIEQETTD